MYLWHYQVKNMTNKSCDFAKKGTKGSRTGSVLEPFLVAAFDKFPIWTVLSIAHVGAPRQAELRRVVVVYFICNMYNCDGNQGRIASNFLCKMSTFFV